MGRSSTPSQVSVVIARAILHAAREQGVAPDALLEEAGLNPSPMEDVDGLMPMADEEALWRVAAKRLGPAFGLLAARSLGRGSFRALEYVVRTSPTLEEGLARLVRFDRILHGMPLFMAQPEGHDVWVVYEGPHDEEAAGAVAGDFALATVVVIGRDAVGMPWNPRQVELAHAPPAEVDLGAYTDLFGCAVHFDAPRYALHIPREALDRPMREADAELNTVLTAILERELPASDEERDLVTSVRQCVVMLLPEGEPELDTVAHALGMAGRTLQKRLRAAGHRYKDLVSEVRSEVAKHHLGRGDATLAGVAVAVGYSELSAFVRAFKKWTGMTPGEFRSRAAGDRPRA